jgi:hypothetical protein
MSFGIYLFGIVLVISGLVYGAALVHVPVQWIVVAALVLLGIGVVARSRPRGSGTRPNSLENDVSIQSVSRWWEAYGSARFDAGSSEHLDVRMSRRGWVCFDVCLADFFAPSVSRGLLEPLAGRRKTPARAHAPYTALAGDVALPLLSV